MLPFAFILISAASLAAQETNQSNIATDGTLDGILNEGVLNGAYRLEVMGEDGPVLSDVTLEELWELKSQANANAQLPATNFASVRVHASVVEDIATVEGQFEVELGQRQTPARIGLRFDSCQLTKVPELLLGQAQVRFRAAESGGYECLLLPEGDTLFTISLQGKSKVGRQFDRRSLTFNLPLVAQARVEVVLPARAAEIRARNDELLEITSDATGVRVVANTRGGDFTLSWRERGSVDRISAVEAQSSTMFEIFDLQQPWVATTELNVRWFGDDSENQFEIELPVGAAWRTAPNPVEFERFQISVVEPEGDAAGDAEGDVTQIDAPEPGAGLRPQHLLVKMLDGDRSDSAKLTLEWEWTPPDSASQTIASDVGIQVPKIIGVDQHKGTIDCVFPSSYSAVYKEVAGARLVQQGSLPDVFGRQQVRQQMQFYFERQDFELLVSFRREQSVPTVRPTYRVNVDQNKLVLTAWFKCSFDTGPQRMQVKIIPGNWIIEENTARSLRDLQNPFSQDSDVLSVTRQEDGSYTLSGSEPEGGFGSSRRVEQVWRIVAERSWTSDDNYAIEFMVPEIIRGTSEGEEEVDHGSGVLLVTSPSSILMRWNETASTGLLSDSFSTEYQKYVDSNWIREPLAYRFQSRGTTPKWAGKGEFLPQQISFDQHCDLELLESEVALLQRFDLRIANEPLSGVRIAVREDVESPPQVFVNDILTSVKLIGKFASPNNTPEASADGPLNRQARPGPGWVHYQLDGAPNLLGTAQISVLSSVPLVLSSSAPVSPQSQERSTSTRFNEAAGDKDIGEPSPPTPAESTASATPATEVSRIEAGKTDGSRAAEPLRDDAGSNVAPASDARLPQGGLSDSALPITGTADLGLPSGDRMAAGSSNADRSTTGLEPADQLNSRQVDSGQKDSAAKDEGILVVPLAQLLLPEGAKSVRQDWGLANDSIYDVAKFDRESGSVTPVSAEERSSVLHLNENELTLQLRKRQKATVYPIIVRGSFLQSVTTGTKRRDRFVALVESSVGKLNIRLPRSAEPESDGVAVDGVALQQSEALYDYNSKTISITLPPSDTPREHVVELFYLLGDTLAWVTPLALEQPVIEGADTRGRFFLQLVTPADQHLGWCPAGLTAEWTWAWSGLWWHRKSEHDQTSLERLLGSSTQGRLPQSANSYVMSSQGPVKIKSLWILSRFVMWFPVGLAAIALSIAALNMRALRTPATAVALAGLIGCVALIWPDLAILLGQTAILALSLVAMILVTQAAIDARVRRRSVFTTRPSTHMDGGSDPISAGRISRVSVSTPGRSGSSVAAAAEK